MPTTGTVRLLQAGNTSLIARCEGKDSNACAVAVAGLPPGSPAFTEDWSNYATDAIWKGSAGTARGWGGFVSGCDPSWLVIDPTVMYPGLARSLKYTFPAPGAVPCNQPAVGREWLPAFGTPEAWIEFAVKWQVGWNTNPNPAWGCGYAADHKFLRIYLSDGNTNSGYFGFKDGHNGDQFNNSYPGGVTPYWDHDVASSSPYYDGNWHIVRLHLKTSNANAGIYYFAIDGVQKNLWIGRNYPVSPVPTLQRWTWGANMNNYPQAQQSYWLGYFKVWTSNPGWG